MISSTETSTYTYIHRYIEILPLGLETRSLTSHFSWFLSWICQLLFVFISSHFVFSDMCSVIFDTWFIWDSHFFFHLCVETSENSFYLFLKFVIIVSLIGQGLSFCQLDSTPTIRFCEHSNVHRRKSHVTIFCELVFFLFSIFRFFRVMLHSCLWSFNESELWKLSSAASLASPCGSISWLNGLVRFSLNTIMFS